MSNGLKLGIEIFIAALGGLAIFVGIDRSTKTRSNNVSNNKPSNSEGGNPAPQVQQPEPSFGDTVINGLRSTQDTCVRVSTFINSLSSVAESTRVLFSKQPVGNYGRNNDVIYNQDGTVSLIRRTPYIVEAVGNGNRIYNNNEDNRYI